MKIVEIPKGDKIYKVKIDDQDVDMIKDYLWIWRDGYACTLVNGRYYQMHRMIMNVPMYDRDTLVDHINGDHCLNTRENLRIADRFQNQQNRKTNKNNTLPKGIRKLPNNKYNVRIQTYNSRIVFGAYDTIEEAVEARNARAKELHGEFFRASHLIEPREENDEQTTTRNIE